MALFIYDVEADGLLDTITYLHCAAFREYKGSERVLFVDKVRWKADNCAEMIGTNILHKWKIRDLTELADWLNTVPTGLVCHNQLGYDLKAFKMLGYIHDYRITEEGLGYINGRQVDILDSLIYSRVLNPDRQLPKDCPQRQYNVVEERYEMVGAHGLAAWGYRVANKKPQVDDWRNQPLFVYVDRVLEDVQINHDTWTELLREAGESHFNIDWSPALDATHGFEYAIGNQKDVGCAFDRELAEKLVEHCDKVMKEIEDKVEPILPERELPKSKQPNFPAKPFKKNGELAATAIKFAAKFDIPEEGAEAFVRGIQSGELEQPKLTEPMRLANQIDLKIWLVKEAGWHPTVFGTKDITKDHFKKTLPKDEVSAKAVEYLEKTFRDSPYRPFMQEILGVRKGGTYDDYKAAVMKHSRALPTSPKFKDDRGDLCPNLKMLQGELADDVVQWLSLRSRRTTLLPLSEKADTGWLNDERIIKEGRITADFTGYTNSYRLKHRGIRNVPKASDDVLLGKEFRQLFYAPKGKVFQTLDTSNMEALIGAWLAWEHDNGALYEVITSGGDTHQMNADAYSAAAGREVGRQEGKGITYGVMYGAQKGKVASMLGINATKAQAVIDAYWDTNYGLKAVREALEEYWEATGKKYIRGIDGRRLYTRSKHSLLNLLIQSTGAIMMNLAYTKVYNKIFDAGLLDLTPATIYYHDEVSFEVDKSLLKVYTFNSKDEAKAFEVEGKYLSEVATVNDKFYRFYSPSGEMMKQAVQEASIALGAPFELTGEYALGRSWADTH